MYQIKLINLLVPLSLSNSTYKEYEYYSFSEIHGYLNCLEAISLKCWTEALKYVKHFNTITYAMIDFKIALQADELLYGDYEKMSLISEIMFRKFLRQM